MTSMKRLFQQIGWFVLVGCAAAGTHWATAVTCIAWLGVRPFIANFMGWLIAVFVSFIGHYFLTFRHQDKSLLPAIGRFLAVSFSGFVVNEASFVYLLHATSVPYQWLLAMILVAIAGLTFVFSRYWVFRRKA
jgi:putative flippase GtrA